MCVFFPFVLDVPAGVAQEEGHTGFLINFPSAVLALIFLARRIQPFLYLVDPVKSNFVVHFYLLFFSEEKSQLPGFELTSQRVRRLRGYQLSYRGGLLIVEVVEIETKIVNGQDLILVGEKMPEHGVVSRGRSPN